MSRRGDDDVNGEGGSETCKDDKHDWAILGILNENDIGDASQDIKVYDKTVVLQRCMNCGKKRVIEEDTDKDVSLELGGMMLDWVESHPEFQRW